jgi:hypothetical protein
VAPVVDAGTDGSVVLPASASLNGTVADDGELVCVIDRNL